MASRWSIQVQLRKGDKLYINDGIYGSLSEMVQGGVRLPARLVRLKGQPSTDDAQLPAQRPHLRFPRRAARHFDLPRGYAGRRLDRDRPRRRLQPRATPPGSTASIRRRLVVVEDAPIGGYDGPLIAGGTARSCRQSMSVWIDQRARSTSAPPMMA